MRGHTTAVDSDPVFSQIHLVIRRRAAWRTLLVATEVALVFAAALSLPSAPVLAATPEAERLEALRDLKEGNRLYDSGDYLAALARFERAYAAVPTPKLFFNFGQTYRRLGRPVEALDFYERFLAESTEPQPQPQLRVEAERWVGELARAVASVEVRADSEGAEVTIDGRSCGVTPLARSVRVAPGSHQIVVQTRGGSAPPYIQKFHAQAGQRIAIDARLAAAGTPPTESQARAPVAPAPRSASSTSPSVAQSTEPVAAVERAAPSPLPEGHRHRIGLALRADVDRGLAGAGAAGGLTYGLTEQIQISAGGFLWPAGGLRVPGASLGLTAYLLRGGLRPILSVEGQSYFRAGAHLAAHAAVGLQWDLSAHLGLFALAGVQYTSSEIVAGERSLFLVPSLGAHVRL
jgi:hypothetical protein